MKTSISILLAMLATLAFNYNTCRIDKGGEKVPICVPVKIQLLLSDHKDDLEKRKLKEKQQRQG